MDASSLFATFAFGFSGLGFGLAGFTIGRIQRELSYRRDSRRNLAVARARADSRARAVRSGIDRADSDRNDFPFGVSYASTDGDGDTDGGTVRAHVGSPGRGAILGADGRARARRYVAGRVVDFPNETPVVTARRAVGYDC